MTENEYNRFMPPAIINNVEYNNSVIETTITTNTEKPSVKDMEEIEINNFSFEGHQVVPAEYFAHRYEPSITFNRCRITLNTACLRRFPDYNYILIMINPDDKQVIVKPIPEDVKDSFVWRTKSNKPKQIACDVFFGMVFDLMKWNPNYRYKLLGKLIKTGEGYIFLFNLSSYEFYEREYVEGEAKPKTSRIAKFPEEWKNRFGLSVEEHKKQLQSIVISDFTIYSLDNSVNNIKTEIKEEHTNE